MKLHWTKELSANLVNDSEVLASSDLNVPTGVEFPLQRGFSINKSACQEYFRRERELPEELFEECIVQIHHLEKTIGRSFGGADDSYPPLLLTVHSMAPSECMRMRLFNIGLTRTAMLSMARFTRNYRESLKSYIQFLRHFGVCIVGLDGVKYEIIERYYMDAIPIADVLQAPVDVLEAVATDFHAVTYSTIPENPYEQLYYAIRSILNKSLSSNLLSNRPQDPCFYLEHDLVVQVMVHSDRNLQSGTGIVYTRSPLTGVRMLAGEYISQSLDGHSAPIGSKVIPMDEIYRKNMLLQEQLVKLCQIVEQHNRDMQAIEFSVEDRRLFLMKSWSGARTPEAALKIAIELVHALCIYKEEALLRIRPFQINLLAAQLLRMHGDQGDEHHAAALLLGTGRPASPGIATGLLLFPFCNQRPPSESYILVFDESAAFNEELVDHSAGLICNFSAMNCPLTRKARLQSKPHIVDICGFEINASERSLTTPNGVVVRERDLLSMNAFTGEVFAGVKCPLIDAQPRPSDEIMMKEFMTFAKAHAKVEIFAYNSVQGSWCSSCISGVYIDSLCDMPRDFVFGSIADDLGSLITNRIEVLPQKVFIHLSGTSGTRVGGLVAACKDDDRDDTTWSYASFERYAFFLIEKQLLAIAKVLLAYASRPEKIYIVLGPIVNAHDLKIMLDALIAAIRRMSNDSPNLRFAIGILISSPRGCFNISQILDTLCACSGPLFESFAIIFKFDPLLDLLMGDRSFACSDIYRYRQMVTSSLFVFDAWGVGDFLEDCFVKIKNKSAACCKDISIGVLASPLHDTELLARFCSRAGVDWLACDMSAAPSALLSAAQGGIAAPLLFRQKEEREE